MNRLLRIALACTALAATLAVAQGPPLPAGLAAARDLRGSYRAAFCARLDAPEAQCAATLRRFAGEAATITPVRAPPQRFRLLFVPGFLAACFPAVQSFDDMAGAAGAEGYRTDRLAVGGRNGIDANARLIATQVDALPRDGRELVFVTHSKGAADVLAMLVAHVDIAQRTRGVITLAGAMQGSPLADSLRQVYAATFALFPFSGCDRGEGDPVADLRPASRAAWWSAGASRVPVYSLVALPDLATLSPVVLPTHAALAWSQGSNDGMVLVRDQVAPGGALLGIVNADHLRIAIPFPGAGYVFLFNASPLPRGALLLAALDVMAADDGATR